MSKKAKKQEKAFAINTKKVFLPSLILIFVLILISFDTRYFLGGDNIRYIILAESLLSGKGYRDINLPSSPPHTTYPPGFPLLLVPFLLLFGENYPLLNTLPLLLSFLSLLILYKILRQKEHFVFFLFALSPIFIEYSHILLSEMPFLFASLLTFYLWQRYETTRSPIFLILSFLSLTFAIFIRTAGISILPAFFFYLLLRKRYKELLLLLGIFLLFFLPYSLRNLSLGRGSGYLELFTYKNPYNPEEGKIGLSEYLVRFGKNCYLYNFSVLPQMLFPYNLSSLLSFLLGLFSLFLIIIAIYQKLKMREFLYPLYLIFSFFILFSWPEVWTGDRFLLPLFPFLIYYLFYGIKAIFHKTSSLIYIFFGIVLIGYLIKDGTKAQENLSFTIAHLRGDKYAGYSLDWVRYFQACEWIRDNTQKDAVIVARKPEFVYFFTKRKSFLYKFSNDPKKILADIEEQSATHLLFDQFFWTGTTIRYLNPVLVSFPERFLPLYATDYPQMVVYQIK